MQLTEGYKQTEVGVIPEDWEVNELNKYAELLSSKRIFEDDYVSVGIPFWRGSEVSALAKGKPISKEYFISTEKYETLKRSFGAPTKGDILVTAVGTLGNIYLVPNNAPFYFKDGNLIWLRNIKHIDHRYLKIQLLANKQQILDGAIGSSQKALTIVALKTLRIPLPPTKAEQEAIAEALSDTDAWIESLEQLIAKKRRIKAGSMQTLLTGKQRLPGFVGEWEVKTLGDLGTWLKGSGVRKDESKSGTLPCVRYGEIYTLHQDYIRKFHSSISREVASTATQIRSGDILFAGSGETKEDIGKCIAYTDDVEAYAGGDIVILRTKGVSPKFLGFYLNTPDVSRQKSSKGQGDAVVHISATALSGISIKIPKSAEQTATAAILSDMDSELDALEAKLSKARQIKQGMMQELLTGKTRLING